MSPHTPGGFRGIDRYTQRWPRPSNEIRHREKEVRGARNLLEIVKPLLRERKVYDLFFSGMCLIY